MIQPKEPCQLNPIISLTKYIDLPHSHLWTVKYFTEETADNTPLLVVHGGPGTTHHYLLPLQHIAQYRPVIFYDQGGCGTSTLKERPKWNVEFFLNELEYLVKALHLKSFHFLGHSWGGALGIEYALAHKKSLKSLTLASPLISGDLWTKDAQHILAKMPIALQDVLRHHEKAGTFDDVEYLKAKQIHDQAYICRLHPEPESLRYSLDHANQPMYLSMFGPHRFKVSGTLASYDRFEDLKRINTIPTLITCGRHDIVIPQTMQKCVDQLPRGMLKIFENSAHFPHLEEEVAYALTLEEFLRTND
jgi:proline iminopeptidase